MLYVASMEGPAAGYTQAALNYLSAFRAAGIPWELVNLGSPVEWLSMPEWAAPLQRRGEPSGRELAVLHHTPDVVASGPKYGEVLNVGLTVYETDRLPNWLVDQLARETDALIVASEANLNGLRGKYPHPIFVLPHTQGDHWWRPPHPVVPEDRPYTFYYIGTANRRKNPEGVLRAYLRAFPEPSPDQCLLMKLTASKTAIELLRAVALEEGQPDRIGGDIQIWAELWGDAQIRWLHYYGNCYVSLHRGEGWGLGPFQAILLGNAVVATDWGAPLEYLRGSEGFLPVRQQLVDAPILNDLPYFRTTGDEAPLRWAEPNLDHAAEQLRHACEPCIVPSIDVAQALRRKYSWETVGQTARGIVEKLEGWVCRR